MGKRFVTIWFRHLKTDWFSRRYAALKNVPFVLTESNHGKIIVTATNEFAEKEGIEKGMAVADARAIVPYLQVLDDEPGISNKLLNNLAIWCIRYTDKVGIDFPDGLKLDVTGCAHLWGGEQNYIRDINLKIKELGYDVRATMADTIGAAWAIAHYGSESAIIDPGDHSKTILSLPIAALRIEQDLIDQLFKLGLRRIEHIINIRRSALQRRFGKQIIHRLEQILGNEEELIFPISPAIPIRERLPCFEPIVTRTGIEIALQQLLEMISVRLNEEGIGIRKAVFYGYRVDGKIETIEIGTHRASFNTKHLFKLFEIKLSSIEPALGIELFILEALKTEKVLSKQESIWESSAKINDENLSELLDRFSNRFGDNHVRQFSPDQHYWPERSYKPINAFKETLELKWLIDKPRPIRLLDHPELVEVTAPVPDYPPMMFRYKNILHKIIKSDGPERIEREWWIEQGLHRDYYIVEDDQGKRYWLFRLGHYEESDVPKWYLHGFFA